MPFFRYSSLTPMVRTRISDDLSRIPEELDEPERPDPAVDPAQDLVVVGHGHEERGRASVHFGHDEQLRHDERLQPFRHGFDLFIRHGHKTPVVAPRRVIDVLHRFQFFR